MNEAAELLYGIWQYTPIIFIFDLIIAGAVLSWQIRWTRKDIL